MASLQKEIDRYQAWLEENPPKEFNVEELDGCSYWECPKCGAEHYSEEKAAECCMPTFQDMDDHKYHSGR